ncbi:MAG TPA: response regulator [Polyangiaceae bacterium]|nr:response regulator [Polyangiaceae bacterium]
MSSSFVVCGDCGESSAAVEWGFVLLARHGWTAQLGTTGSEPTWRCPACNERLNKDGWDFEADDFSPTKRRLRVLLVDDQALVLRATASMLKELDVVTAHSGAEALARIEEGGHYDVVVSDVTMPNMSGPELFIVVRQRFPQLATRFLLLSGDSYGASLLCSAIARREGLAQMPRILDKPVPRNELVRAIEEMARRHLPRSGTFAIDLDASNIAADVKTK